jgi:hypothetical protein
MMHANDATLRGICAVGLFFTDLLQRVNLIYSYPDSFHFPYERCLVLVVVWCSPPSAVNWFQPAWCVLKVQRPFGTRDTQDAWK